MKTDIYTKEEIMAGAEVIRQSEDDRLITKLGEELEMAKHGHKGGKKGGKKK